MSQKILELNLFSHFIGIISNLGSVWDQDTLPWLSSVLWGVFLPCTDLQVWACSCADYASAPLEAANASPAAALPHSHCHHSLSHRASIECHSLAPPPPASLPLRSLGGVFRGQTSVRCSGTATDRLSCVSRLFVEFGPPLPPPPFTPSLQTSLGSHRTVARLCPGGLRQQAEEIFFRQDKHRSVSCVSEREQIAERLFLGCGFKGPLSSRIKVPPQLPSEFVPNISLGYLLHSHVAHTWQTKLSLWSKVV